jgi:hypothetical protein
MCVYFLIFMPSGYFDKLLTMVTYLYEMKDCQYKYSNNGNHGNEGPTNVI